jgi:hypothetical protein
MRSAERIVAAAFLGLAIVLVWEAVYLGIGWASDGPSPGFVPFWLALLVGAACLVLLLRDLRTVAVRQEPFFPSVEACLFWLKVLLPVVGVGLLFESLGVYIVTALYLAFFAAWIGRHRWYVVLGVGALIPLVLYVAFEQFFKLPLPKSLLYGHGLPF